MKIGKWIAIAFAIGLLAFLILNPQLLTFLQSGQRQTIIINRGSAETGSAETGSAETGSAETGSTETGEEVDIMQEYELVTLLPLDGIPAIDDPQFVTGAEANEQYAPDELVIGIEINGDARAYSIPFLSGHEIVNDVIDGQPIAVTW